MGAERPEVSPLDVLAWVRCPLAAANGYRPAHPLGREDLGRAVLQAFPRSVSRLTDFTPDGRRAAEWLGQTRFGAARAVDPFPEPPPRALTRDAAHGPPVPVGYWAGEDRGVLRMPTADLRFQLPYVHRVNGAWEVVFLDTLPTPPDPERSAAVTLHMAVVTEAFRALTGEWAGARLLAPAYEHEEAPELPEQGLVQTVSMMRVLEPMAFMRPGRHCDETEEHRERGQVRRRWACPLRASGRCRPVRGPRPSLRPTERLA